MHSYLNSAIYPKYDALYNKIMAVLKDITQFSSGVTNEVINPSKDKLAMYRLNNYILTSLNIAMSEFENLKKDF